MTGPFGHIDPFDYSQPELGREFPIVFHVEDWDLEQLEAMQDHGDRIGTDLEHCDPERSHLTEVVIGQGDWARREVEFAKNMRRKNQLNEAAAKRAKGRPGEAKKILAEPGRICKTAKNKPYREIVYSVNHKWFLKKDDEGRYILDKKGDPIRDEKKLEEFRKRAKTWIMKNFGEHILHFRFDGDELAEHAHVFLAKWQTTRSKNRGEQTLLVPTKIPLIGNLKRAQDEAWKPFEDMGVIRGRDIADQRRQAREEGKKDLPKKPRHKSVHQWRAEERIKYLEEKREANAAREFAEITTETKRGEWKEAELARRDQEAQREAARKAAEEFYVKLKKMEAEAERKKKEHREYVERRQAEHEAVIRKSTGNAQKRIYEANRKQAEVEEREKAVAKKKAEAEERIRAADLREAAAKESGRRSRQMFHELEEREARVSTREEIVDEREGLVAGREEAVAKERKALEEDRSLLRQAWEILARKERAIGSMISGAIEVAETIRDAAKEMGMSGTKTVRNIGAFADGLMRLEHAKAFVNFFRESPEKKQRDQGEAWFSATFEDGVMSEEDQQVLEKARVGENNLPHNHWHPIRHEVERTAGR